MFPVGAGRARGESIGRMSSFVRLRLGGGLLPERLTGFTVKTEDLEIESCQRSATASSARPSGPAPAPATRPSLRISSTLRPPPRVTAPTRPPGRFTAGLPGIAAGSSTNRRNNEDLVTPDHRRPGPLSGNRHLPLDILFFAPFGWRTGIRSSSITGRTPPMAPVVSKRRLANKEKDERHSEFAH